MHLVRKVLKPEPLLLLLALVLAFYVAFIPRRDYPYPVHIDEWLHMAYTRAMLQSADTSFIDPFSGDSLIMLGNHWEIGFYAFLGVFQKLTGIDWLTIFRFGPAVMLMLITLAVYVLAHREGFGWEAAFFAALIPTTVGILGPAFLVPLSFGLLLTPLIMFVAFNFSGFRSYAFIFLMIAALLAIHPPSAIFPVILLTPYILLNLRGNFKHSSGVALGLLLPFFVVFPWITGALLPTFKSLLTPHEVASYVQLPLLIKLYGYLTVALALAGAFTLAFRGGKRGYGMVLGLLLLLAMLAVFYSLHYGLSIIYERGLMPMILMLGVMAGAGLMAIRTIRLPGKLAVPGRYAGWALAGALIVMTLFINLPRYQSNPYYYIIDREDYEAFLWIRENIGGDYTRAVLDPWKATSFTAVTGKSVYARLHMYATGNDLAAYEFLQGGCRDTDFLRRNGISIVYTRAFNLAPGGPNVYPVDNPELLQAAPNVYLLKKGD